MSSPLSPVVANLLEQFEKDAFDYFSYKLRCWFRYIDDTLNLNNINNTNVEFYNGN